MIAAQGSLAFDPELLRNQKKPFSAAGHKKNSCGQRIYVVVQDYETGFIGKRPTMYVRGWRLDDPTKRVRVRLNSVSERFEDLAAEMSVEQRDREGAGLAEKVRQQYSKGTHRRTPLAYLKEKNPKLIKFDSAILLGAEGDEEEYRAHWAEGVVHGTRKIDLTMASVVIHPGSDDVRPCAYIETLNFQDTLGRSNALLTLKHVLDSNNRRGPARKYCHMRLFFNGEMLHSERVFPPKKKEMIKDPKTGKQREVFRWLSGADALKEIMNPSRNPSSGHDMKMIRSHDYVRTVVMAVLQSDNRVSGKEIKFPDLRTRDDPGFMRDMRNVFNGIVSGQLVADVIGGEVINFGPGTARTLLKQVANESKSKQEGKKFYSVRHLYCRTEKRPPLVRYVGTDKYGRNVEKASAEELHKLGCKPEGVIRREIPSVPAVVRGFLPTVIVYDRHRTGVKYATFAEPLKDGDKVTLTREMFCGKGLYKVGQLHLLNRMGTAQLLMANDRDPEKELNTYRKVERGCNDYLKKILDEERKKNSDTPRGHYKDHEEIRFGM